MKKGKKQLKKLKRLKPQPKEEALNCIFMVMVS